MDRVRFGSLTFLAAGERIRLKGKYEYNGRTRYEFDDAAEHRRSGSGGCSHEWWHKFNEKRDNKQLRAHVHMKMNELAYFMKRLDATGSQWSQYPGEFVTHHFHRIRRRPPQRCEA